MGLNENNKEKGETNENEAHDDQHATALDQIQFSPGSPSDHSMLSKNSRSSASNPKSSESVTPYKGNNRNNIAAMEIYPLQSVYLSL